MAYLGNLPIFDHKSSEWSIFKSRLTQFSKINRVEEVNKSGILLTHLTDETYRLVRNLAYPQDLESLSYSNLVKLLDGHFKPKKCSFVDKEKFFGATRNPGESLGDWAARLRGLASNCDFGTALETNLRDRFVLGLGPGPEQDKLFEQDPSTLTLSVAMELAEQAAYARRAKVMLCTSEHATIKEEPVYRAKFQGQGDSGAVIRRPNAGRTSGGRDQPRDFSRCSVCGLKNHQSDKCRYKSYKCQKCGEKGHLKKVCDSINRSRMYHIESVSEPEQVKDTSCEECHNFNLRDMEVWCIRHVDQIIRYTGSDSSRDDIVAAEETRCPSTSPATVNAHPPAQQPMFPAISNTEQSMEQATNMQTAELQSPSNTGAPNLGSSDHGEAEEVSDCETREYEKDNIAPVERPMAETEAVPSTIGDSHVPPTLPLLATRPKRTRPRVDYKKYF
ncbi:unnamed protein product [Parnassius apollo]|uniref:(apollo) hypothetical protein n=1 Tax=Parnassius apollo TaxID=110799 RepID=A0A8S3WB62_PARAO|nr:unnamed protein product [Parnassius apollo]